MPEKVTEMVVVPAGGQTDGQHLDNAVMHFVSAFGTLMVRETLINQRAEISNVTEPLVSHVAVPLHDMPLTMFLM